MNHRWWKWHGAIPEGMTKEEFQDKCDEAPKIFYRLQKEYNEALKKTPEYIRFKELGLENPDYSYKDFYHYRYIYEEEIIDEENGYLIRTEKYLECEEAVRNFDLMRREMIEFKRLQYFSKNNCELPE